MMEIILRTSAAMFSPFASSFGSCSSNSSPGLFTFAPSSYHSRRELPRSLLPRTQNCCSWSLRCAPAPAWHVKSSSAAHKSRCTNSPWSALSPETPPPLHSETCDPAPAAPRSPQIHPGPPGSRSSPSPDPPCPRHSLPGCNCGRAQTGCCTSQTPAHSPLHLVARYAADETPKNGTAAPAPPSVPPYLG